LKVRRKVIQFVENSHELSLKLGKNEKVEEFIIKETHTYRFKNSLLKLVSNHIT